MDSMAIMQVCTPNLGCLASHYTQPKACLSSTQCITHSPFSMSQPKAAVCDHCHALHCFWALSRSLQCNQARLTQVLIHPGLMIWLLLLLQNTTKGSAASSSLIAGNVLGWLLSESAGTAADQSSRLPPLGSCFHHPLCLGDPLQTPPLACPVVAGPGLHIAAVCVMMCLAEHASSAPGSMRLHQPGLHQPGLHQP